MVRWGWIGGAQCNPILDLTGHDQGRLWFLIEVEDRGFLRHDSSDHLRASPNCAASQNRKRWQSRRLQCRHKEKGDDAKKSGSML